MSLAVLNTSASSALIIQPQPCSSCSCSSVLRLVSRPPLSRYLQKYENRKKTRYKRQGRRQRGGGGGARVKQGTEVRVALSVPLVTAFRF